MKIKKAFFHNYLLISLIFSLLSQFAIAQGWGEEEETDIIVGAERMSAYFPFLIQKNVGIVMNHTSTVKDFLLVDTLLQRKIRIKKLFTPEHGLRGNVDAGKEIQNGIDPETRLPVISLYGENKKPSPADLAGLDVILFDLQDVGARFYTYISTMHYVMQACAENDIQLIVLDRPNPNSHYVDGPILQQSHRSFVGLHPIPIVHGMTIGELAKMINEEGWLGDDIYTKKQCKLEVIPCANYLHGKEYILPVNPSPNLPNMQSIHLYPSLCLFEGTVVSVGRGTAYPFQIYGHPKYHLRSFAFRPKSIPGKSSRPKYMGEDCLGWNLIDIDPPNFTLKYLVEAYQAYPDKEEFFNSYFRKLVGNDDIQRWIEEGKSAQLISQSWKKDVEEFKKLRSQYLLYEDFE